MPYKTIIHVTGAGDDKPRCLEFDDEGCVLDAAQSLVDLQAAAIAARKKELASKSGASCCKCVEVTAVTRNPDGSLYHKLSLTYPGCSDGLIAAVAAIEGQHEQKHKSFLRP